MAFSPEATALPYTGFPFGSSFPSASTCFSARPTIFIDSSVGGGGSYFSPFFSQLVGPPVIMPCPYPRLYVISLPDGNAVGGTESSSKLARQGLDLNNGFGNAEELKENRMPLSPKQISFFSSRTFMDDQTRLYQLGSGSLKRKVPGACEAERVNYSQPLWQ